jgi:hypothetical protein
MLDVVKVEEVYQGRARYKKEDWKLNGSVSMI